MSEVPKHPEKHSIDIKEVTKREVAEAKVYDNLLEAEPYPLVHYTQPSTAARIMVEGLTSIASSRESGRHIRAGNNWQGERQISVTDVEGYLREQEQTVPGASKNGEVLLCEKYSASTSRQPSRLDSGTKEGYAYWSTLIWGDTMGVKHSFPGTR